MIEFNTLSDIFGRSVEPMIKEMSEVVVFNVDADGRSCCMLLNGREYTVKRVRHNRWHVAIADHWWSFGSQWELLAWIGDRL